MRTATTVWAAFFLVVAAGSYGSLAVIEKPTATVEQPAHTLSGGENFTIDGRTYHTKSVDARHNTDDELVRSGELSWTNESAIREANFANNSTVTLQGTDYQVAIPNESDPSQATLLATNETNETEENNGTDQRRLEAGSSLTYRNNSTTVTNVSREAVSLQWRGPKQISISLGETEALETTLVRGWVPRKMQFPAGGSNVTLNGEAFTVHYPDNATVQLSRDREGYQQQLQQVRHRNERIAGLWGVMILSSLTAILFTGLANLPTKR